MPDSRWRKLSAVRSAVRIDPSGPTILDASWPGSREAPSGTSAKYSHGGRTASNTRAAASAPLRTPGLLAMIFASPFSSGSTTRSVVTSKFHISPPRSSRSARATRSSSSGFDETIGLLTQAECLLGEPEEICALTSDATVLARWLDDAPVDDLPPEVAAVDGEAEHRFVHVLELGDREFRRQQLEAERRVADLAPQAAHRVIDDLAVVERHLHREPAHRMPLLAAPIDRRGAALRLSAGHDRDVGDSDHVTARVAARHNHLP